MLGSTPDFGAMQPAIIAGEEKRIAQLRVIAGFIRELQALDRNVFICALGDFNTVSASQALCGFSKQVGMTELVHYNKNERFTYMYDGNSVQIDHVFASAGLVRGVVGVYMPHVNRRTNWPVSDHDPMVVRFRV